MLTILQGGFHVDLEGEIKSRIAPLIEKGRRVFLIVPEMETLIAEEEAAKSYPPYAPRFFEVTNFSRLANTLFREKGGLTEDPYDKTAKALLMWRALSEAMPLLSENTKNDVSVGTVERALRAVNEMQQLAVDRDTLDEALTEDEILKNGRLSGKVRDLSTIMDFYGRLLREDGKITSQLSRMAEKLSSDPEIFSDACFFLEGFSSFTEVEYEILSLLLSRTDLTVALRLPKHRSDAFEYTETRTCVERLERLCAKLRIEYKRYVFDTNRMVKNESLAEISKLLWMQNIKIDNDCLQNLGDSLRIFSARTPYEQASFIAADIAKRVREGGLRYSDFAIVARDASALGQGLEAALREGGIPAFLSKEHSINSLEGVKVIDLAYRAILGGYSRADVIAYSKCALTGLTREVADTFELYVDKWDIHGRAFADENAFHMSPDGYSDRHSDNPESAAEQIRRAREIIIEPLLTLAEASNKRQSVSDHAHALVDFLVRLDLCERLRLQGEHLTALGEEALGRESASLWHIIVKVLDKVVETLPDFHLDARAFASLLGIAFSQVKLGRLPESSDEVTIGSANSLRLYGKKHVYLVSVNYGEFPAGTSDGSYFTERERELLHSVGVATEPSADVRCAKEQFFFTRAFLSASDSVTLITTEKNASFKSTPPASVLTHLERASDKALRPVRIDSLPIYDRIQSVRTAVDALAYEPPEEDRALILEALNRGGERTLVHLAKMPIYNASLSLSRELASELYPKEISLTQSRLESFIGCPLSHFLSFVLQLKEEKPVTFDALSIGNMVHAILEKFFLLAKERGSDFSVYDEPRIREEVTKIADGYLKGIGFYSAVTPAKRAHTAKRITEGAIAVVVSLVDELRGSKFVPAFFELKIKNGTANAPAPHLVTDDDGTVVRLYGTIDRVDTYLSGDTAFVRVVDYKTGSKTFSPQDLAEGKNLQMFLYLASVLESASFRTRLGISEGGEVVPAGVSYVHTALEAKAAPDESFNALQTVRSLQKRAGMVLFEDEVIAAMNPDYLPITLNKEGKPNANSAPRAYTRDGWRMIMQTVDNSVLRVAGEMRSGEIPASPLKGKGSDACTYCPYRPVCRKTKG